MDPSEFYLANCVLHRYAKVFVRFEELGLGKITFEWTIGSNWNESEAFLSNGKRMRVVIHEDLPASPFFDNIDKRTSDLYGDNSWENNFGSDMHEKRKHAAKEAAEKKDAAIKAEKEDLLAGVVTPTKRRRIR